MKKPGNIAVPVTRDLTGGTEVVVNGVATADFYGSLHTLILTRTSFGLDEAGDMRKERHVVARLAFDTEMATNLRDALNIVLEAVSVPGDVKRN